ncbi:FAD-binding oxidoreductase [Taibaiella sp. KBW10]|uniref:FAD-binding oxidoreductase n=1 Tax=Taibaiella sp. KBW10 TaxID=2153357 RepID=UPI000F5AAE64|nr:FAD-binding oxidoreductase [Taibaiella sp. KBW10]RQO32352.1 FAD-binding oxidoreductase [Taibaiella sp. KBW10]
MKTYSKREFLKMMGLGVAFMPFISCFGNSNNNQAAAPGLTKDKEHPEDPKSGSATPDDITKAAPGDVILLTRSDAAYASFNTAFNARVKKMPKYIALCKTPKGVQMAVAFAKQQKLPTAVKSGGHSFEGFSSNDGGLVINVSQMKKITWTANNMVTIEPGCLLEEIQAALFAKKQLIPSGSCGTVGIAGLTLGGGYGFFSRKYGLTCDSLQALDIVAGDGKTYHSSGKEELLWACKGGGNGNFGVVTQFQFKTQPMPATFTSIVLKFRNLNTDHFYTVLSQWFETTPKLAPEDFSAFVLNGSTLTILCTTYGNNNNLERNIQALTGIADTVNKSMNQNLPQAMKRYYGRKGPILFKNASAGLYKDFGDIKAIATQIFNSVVQNKGLIYQINTLGGNINNTDFEQGSCYPHRALPYLSELQAYWENPAQEAKLLKAFQGIQELILAAGITAQYRNYPDINFKNWQQAYYGQHYAKLQTIKGQYDPENLFQYPQSITL